MGLSPSHEFIARRYDRLAWAYRLIELLFWLPPRFRRRAVDRLELRPGDRVLEIGCGSGRNLGLLRSAVGPTGLVEGIDISPGMLARATRLITRRGWANVSVVAKDAAKVESAECFEAVLFSLSYSVIPNRDLVLARAWGSLVKGGRLVIMDACLPEGRRGRWLRPLAVSMSRATVLGDPEIRAWEELAGLSRPVNTERNRLGNYVITSIRKPLA